MVLRIYLRTWHALSGTELGYNATYLPTRCPDPVYAAVRCAVLGWRMVLPVPFMSNTELAYGAIYGTELAYSASYCLRDIRVSRMVLSTAYAPCGTVLAYFATSFPTYYLRDVRY